jgi:DNA-binding HxlR family transcriptional regulator
MKLQKETKGHGKWYDDACGTAFALELIGERWSLLIVRELIFGGRRFTDLRAGLPGISAKVLTERLEGLERAGIVRKRQLPPPAATQIYELTPWGYMAEEPIKALGRWAACSPDHDPTLPLSPASLMLSFRTMFDPARVGDGAFAGALLVGGDQFMVELTDGAFRAERGAPEAPDFTIAAPAATLIAALVYGKAPAEALAEAGLTMTGSKSAAERFVDLFHLPEKVGGS